MGTSLCPLPVEPNASRLSYPLAFTTASANYGCAHGRSCPRTPSVTPCARHPSRRWRRPGSRMAEERARERQRVSERPCASVVSPGSVLSSRDSSAACTSARDTTFVVHASACPWRTEVRTKNPSTAPRLYGWMSANCAPIIPRMRVDCHHSPVRAMRCVHRAQAAHGRSEHCVDPI